MTDSLVGSVVHIYEKRFPVAADSRIVDCESMILRGDETLVCAHFPDRLVVTSMTIDCKSRL